MGHVKCILCGADKYVTIFTNAHDEYKKRIPGLSSLEVKTTFVACKFCGFVYQNPRLEENQLAEMYKKDYRIVPPEKHNPPDIGMQAEWILDNIENKTSGKEILDIGCGTGSLLNIFKKSGWDTYGVEPTISYAEYGIRENGHKIEMGLYNDKSFNGARFDLITISHVLEHVLEPISLLFSVKNKLKKSGYIYIGVPNVTRPKIYFWDVFSCGHLYLFSPASITNILHKVGLDIFTIREIGARKAIDVIVHDIGRKNFDFFTEDPRVIKKAINITRLKAPFLEARRKIGDFYKSFYKARVRKPLKRILSFLLGRQASERFFS